MITIEDKRQCCGCSSCVQRCPKHCITMMEDEEGFLYPHVDATLCIDCGLCENVCPVINQEVSTVPLRTYTAKNPDLKKREHSSSGGLFIALAEKVIEHGGVVFGVVFDENWEAHHVAATTTKELEPMMRSKYMQSRVENTFAEAEKYLKEGREVMFTGTPCQIAGLRRFLRKEYDNLLAVDIVCHGVPSPEIWRKYLNELSGNQVIKSINFRDKEGYKWDRYGMTIKFNNSILSSTASKNIFFKGFLQNLYLRPSCFDCPAKSGKSRSDITLCDFWGVKSISANDYDEKGVSLVLIHTLKADRYINSLSLAFKDVEFKEAIKYNSSYVTSTTPNNKTSEFYALAKTSLVSSAIEKFISNPSLFQRVVFKVKSLIQI